MNYSIGIIKQNIKFQEHNYNMYQLGAGFFYVINHEEKVLRS